MDAKDGGAGKLLMENDMTFKTIAELYAAVKSGKIDESQLTVQLNTCCTLFHIGDDWDDESKDVGVDECNGYYDKELLYKLLFPNATVEWV